MVPTDQQIVESAEGFRDGILDGRPSWLMCYAVAAPLQGWLSFAYSLDTEMVESEFDIGPAVIGHFWLRLPDGRTLDPTADQFNPYRDDPFPKVYLGAPTEIHIEKRVE